MLGREPESSSFSRERGGLVRARAQWLSTSREWGLVLGREPGRVTPHAWARETRESQAAVVLTRSVVS